MAEIYKFFNSTKDDKRLYQAEDFSDFFAEFLSSGLLHRDGEPFMKVSIGADRARDVVVSAGSAIVEGHLYKNTAPIKLVNNQEGYPRINRVVLRLDKSTDNRNIKMMIKEGTPSSRPIPPELIREGDVYELSLASIRVATVASGSELTIVDERYESDLCGVVDSLISIPIEDLQDDFSGFKNQLNDDFYAWFDDAIRQSNVELLEGELKLIKQNQIEILMQRYVEGKSTDMDAGYFFDVLKDWSKINKSRTTAELKTVPMQLDFPADSLEAEVVWRPHNIGFVASKVKHYHSRPVQDVLTLKKDAPAGQNKIEVSNVSIEITEVKNNE